MKGWSPLSWALCRCEDSVDAEIGSKAELVESINLVAFGVHDRRVVVEYWRAK